MQSARAYVKRLAVKLRYLTGLPVLRFNALERPRTPDNLPPPPVKTNP